MSETEPPVSDEKEREASIIASSAAAMWEANKTPGDPTWLYDPPYLDEYVESRNYLGYLPLSRGQRQDAIALLGENPKQIFSGGSIYTIAVNLWGKGCISGDAKLIDQTDGTEYTVKQLYESQKSIQVECYDEQHQQKTVSELSAPFIKGEEILYDVELETGQKVRVSKDHKFLTKSGEWKKLSELKEGDEIVSEDLVACKLCGRSMQCLSPHLKDKHNSMSLNDYKKLFPELITHTQALSKKVTNSGSAHGMYGRKHTAASNEQNSKNNHKGETWESRFGKKEADRRKKLTALNDNRNPMIDPARKQATIDKIIKTKNETGVYERWADKMAHTAGYCMRSFKKTVYISKYAGEITVIGSYELRTCVILDRMCDLGVYETWQYVPDKIRYQAFDGKMRLYTPDFKIWTSWSIGIYFYIEVKGWMDAKSKLKMDAVIDKIPVQIWFKENIEAMEKAYANKIL